MSDFTFTATCEPTDLKKCPAGTRYMDPCDCKNYYQCTNDLSMSTSMCSEGTLWDIRGSNCNHDNKVRSNQTCAKTNSWFRCNTTANRLEELRELCTGRTTISPNMTAKPPVLQPSKETNVNAGMVAGLIIAGAVITLAIIALFVLYSRRKKAREQKLKRRATTTAENPEYFENGRHDDPYAIIDDQFVSAVYNNNNVISGTMSNTMSTTTTTLPGEGDLAVYDNSAFRETDYTSTLEHEQTPYDTLSASAKSYEKPKTSRESDVTVGGDVTVNGDVIAGVSGSLRSSTEGETVDSARSVANSDNVGLNEDQSYDNDQAPDYYKLEPE